MRMLGISKHFDDKLEELEKNTKDDKSITKKSKELKDAIIDLDKSMERFCALYPDDPKCVKWRKYGLDYIHNA